MDGHLESLLGFLRRRENFGVILFTVMIHRPQRCKDTIDALDINHLRQRFVSIGCIR